MGKNTDADDISGGPEDFSPIIKDAISGIHWKMIIFLFLIYIIVTSDVFINRILTNFKDSTGVYTSDVCPNTRGTVIQGLFLVLFYIVIDTLIKKGVV